MILMRKLMYCSLVSLETEAINVTSFSCGVVGCAVAKAVTDMIEYNIDAKEEKLVKYIWVKIPVLP